jgi:hypothetical protein
LKYQIAAPISTTTKIQMTCPNSIVLSLPCRMKKAAGGGRKQFSRKNATPHVRPAVAPAGLETRAARRPGMTTGKEIIALTKFYPGHGLGICYPARIPFA